MSGRRRQPTYRGRFAPSPTGALHFGSLIAATGSYLQARSRQGEWCLRIDDIDPPREAPGARDTILKTLAGFGFEWDGPVTYQSQHADIYAEALITLQDKGLVYPCACSRKVIAQAQAANTQNPVYPGTCRRGLGPGQSARMLRINTEGVVMEFQDLLQGKHRYVLETTQGDFVVRRADGLFAYQLATGIDDAMQGMTEVIRGSDLLDTTPCQMFIQQALDLKSPTYGHLPVALNSNGQKLSKQTHARPLDIRQAVVQLWQALDFLGQKPAKDLRESSLKTLWEWAFANWHTNNITRQTTIEFSDIAQH